MSYHETVLSAIGHTPLVKLQKIAGPDDATVLAKLEYLNPGGSIKEVDGNWVENTVNYADAPPEGALISRFPDSTTGGNLSVDVTIVGLDGRTEISFYITSEGSQSFEFYAHEKGSDFAPRLLITWSHNPAVIPLTPTAKPPVAGLQTNPPQNTITPIAVPSAILPDNSGDPSVVAAGDMICDSFIPGPTYCQYKAVADAALAQNPSAVLVLGDECHLPSVDCYNNYFKPTWGRMFDISYPISGNHDYLVAAAANYYDYWNGAGVVSGKAGERDKGYYSFELGAWHMVALNSQCGSVNGCGPGSPQYKWLEQDLKDLKVSKSQCDVGDGVLPIGPMFRELKRTRYSGVVHLEYEINADNPLPGMQKSVAYMRGVLAGLRA